MKKYIQFESKRDLIKALKVRGIRRKVSPNLKLSSEALKNPLPKGLLSELRDFLTRSGEYADFSINPIEHFICYPGTRVKLEEPVPKVIGPNEPFFISLGIGELSFLDGSISCMRHAVQVFDVESIVEKFSCGRVFWCGWFSGDIDCAPKFKCGNFTTVVDVEESHQMTDFVVELQSNLQHPFVQELMQYFGTESLGRLGKAVSDYVFNGMFDQSVIQE